MKSILAQFMAILAFSILLQTTAWAQGVSINTDGSDPDGSAILDVKSTTQGLLIPRMDFAQMFAISNPANGLMVYCTTFNSFYYYSGGMWNELSGGEDDDWTVDGNDMFSNNSGLIGIGTSTTLPTHKLTIENVDNSNVLRLIGPGPYYGYYGTLNFGDGSYVYLTEYEDDKLMVYGSSGLSGISNYDLTFTSNYSNILFNASSGGVGINLPDVPGSALDVNGTVRIRQGDPAPYKMLTSTDANGNATWQPDRSLKFPDGQFPNTPVTHLFSSGGYTVPTGKNLYILNVYNNVSGGIYMRINGLPVSYGYSNNNYYGTMEMPIIAGAGDIITSNSTAPTAFNGFLIDATIVPVTTNNTLTVPAGQTFVLVSVCSPGGLRNIVVNGISLAFTYGNFNTGSNANYHGLKDPILVGEGSVVYYNGGTMNGYFITQ